MILMNEIPDRFWSLFRSVNRSTYIEALLKINEEYEYSNYFLSREVCIQLLSEYFSQKKYVIWQDETEDDWDELEPPATRVLNWLLRTGWLRKVDDYASMTVNIVIPDYAAVMIEAFSRLLGDDEDETQVYIQNVYAILFSLKNDPRSSVSLLNTALINTKKLNKSLQDMLHNMDKFFGSLLEQKNYGTLLKEHLEGYDIVEKLDQLERGFDDIEHRISNMDKEHSRYVKATVTRLNYLLNQEDNMKGLVIRLLNHLSEYGCPEEELTSVSARMNLSQMTILSEKSLYKRRKTKADFTEQLKDEEESEELSMEEVLNLNKVRNRYSQKEIEAFIEGSMTEGKMVVDEQTIHSDQDFEKLILAYDYSTRRKSPYKVEEEDSEMVHCKGYTYPRLVFVRRAR